MTIILGIDPGSRITGYGIIEQSGDRYTYRASGCIRMTIGNDLITRLQQISSGLVEIISHHQPEIMAIENIFVHRNPQSAIKLGQARGAAIATAGRFNLKLAEYTPRQVKQAVVGNGGAKKEQVQHMVKVLLNLPSAPQSDAADALAVALCHAHSHGRLISQVTKRRRRRFTLASLA